MAKAKKTATPAPSATADHVDGAPVALAEAGHPDDPPPSHELSAEPAPAPPPVEKVDLKKWEGAVLIPLDKLIFTSWNVNEMPDAEFSELVAEIEAGATAENPMGGFDEPCDVVPCKDLPGSYLVLGGEHRTRAANSLQWKEVPCVIKTHLIGADEATLMQWSVKRNHLRGRVNKEKYVALERSLSEKHKIQLEAARQRMLVKGELLKSIQKDAPSGDGAGSSSGDGPSTDGDKDKKKEVRDRKKLLEALKTAETDVLLQSADTVEHGYLYFGQGDKGQKHLVVDESKELSALISRVVAACKGESMRVDEFFCSAIAAELPKWEAK